MFVHESDPILTDLRPDLLGAITAFFDDDEFTELAYFTTEADAREGEAGDARGRRRVVRRVGAGHEGRAVPRPARTWLTSAG